MTIVNNAVSMPICCLRKLRLLEPAYGMSDEFKHRTCDGHVTSYWSFESMQQFGKQLNISLPHKTPKKFFQSSKTEFGHQHQALNHWADAQMPTTKNIERQMVSVGDPISQKNATSGFTWVFVASGGHTSHILWAIIYD